MAEKQFANNLFQLNAPIKEADDFEQEMICRSIHHSIREYIDYLNSCIKSVHNEHSIKVKVVPIKNTKHADENTSLFEYSLQLNELSDKKFKRAYKILYEDECREIYTNPPTGTSKNDVTEKITDRNEEERTLIFQNEIEGGFIYLKGNDYSLKKQKQALMKFKNQPTEEMSVLRRLFDHQEKSTRFFVNNTDELEEEIIWNVLKDETRDGTDEQREFVEKALESKDFTLLEGPPGSGKTTAILELISQYTKQGLRILLVSQTHVAVDNVLERIINSNDDWTDSVAPLRIGALSSISKPEVKPYQINNQIRTVKTEIKKRLQKENRTESEKSLLQSINEHNEIFDEIVLKSANLVAGTMLGVLQHPDIKGKDSLEMFDVMIVDESSKVTFLDFIVPALYAKKWVLVGDKNQLPPFSEDDFITDYLRTIGPTKEEQKSIIKRYQIMQYLDKQKDHSACVLFSDNSQDDYHFFNENYEDVFQLEHTNNDEVILQMNASKLIITNNSDAHKKIINRSLWVPAVLFDIIAKKDFALRQTFFHKRKKISHGVRDFIFTTTKMDWAEELQTKLALFYQYRFDTDGLWSSLEEDIKMLCNYDDAIIDQVEKIRRLAFPSILELLQIGVGKKVSRNGNEINCVIYKGFSEATKDEKFQTLSYQHRMQAEIAETPKKHFYDNTNLLTANTVRDRRNKMAYYKSSETPVVWVTNSQFGWKKKNKNDDEVRHIEDELKQLDEFSRTATGEISIAVITFYRDQERALRTMLQKWSSSKRGISNFSKNKLKIRLCTVDRFQGDEADVVLLSFAVYKRKAFYNNPNRLNVALTRARFKLVLFGNKNWLEKSSPSKALKELATKFETRLKR